MPLMVCKAIQCKKPAKTLNQHSEEQENFFEQNQFTPTAMYSHYQVTLTRNSFTSVPLTSPLVYFILQCSEEEKLSTIKIKRYLACSYWQHTKLWSELSLNRLTSSGSHTLTSMRIRRSGIKTCRCSNPRSTDYDGALNSVFLTITRGDFDTQIFGVVGRERVWEGEREWERVRERKNEAK